MEEDKENFANLFVKKSKIPLPKQPLPPVPKHLLKATSVCVCQDVTQKLQRQPLKTLNSKTHAGPSRYLNIEKRTEINSKYVTVRQPRRSSPDWSPDVFKDYLKGADRKKTKKDAECKKDTNGVVECDLLAIEAQVESRPETPFLSQVSLEPVGIRNIKRSLKRPHSRELQGLSPMKEPTKRINCDNVKSKLNFGDRICDRLKSPDYVSKRYMISFCKDYSKDLYEYLLKVERKPVGIPHLATITRACIVNWICKINGEDGEPAITQAACWFLDSLLGIREVHLEKLQVTAAACYWIAQKLNGPYVSATRLVKNGGSSYTSHELRRAEQNVLNVLNFPPHPVVPQDYVSYLSWWCDSDHPGEIEVASSFLCLSGLLVDKELACEYPSVIASAAINNAIQLLEKKHLLPRLLSNPIYCSAKVKCSDFINVCSSLRKAASVVGYSCCEYRVPYIHYSRPPHNIAQRLLKAIKIFELNEDDIDNT